MPFTCCQIPLSLSFPFSLRSTVINQDTTGDLLLRFMFMNKNLCLKLRHRLNYKITMNNPIYEIKADVFALRKSSS